MKQIPISLSTVGSALALASVQAASAQTYTVLHAFTGSDGANPAAQLTPTSGGTIYGTTASGGPNPHLQAGTVFESDTSGNIVTLHAFVQTDGQGPNALTLVGNTLYASAASGGSGKCGVLFSLKTDGTAYTDLHDFAGKQGCNPIGTLQHLPGHGFIGVTQYGGPGYQPSSPNVSGKGVLFLLSKRGKYRVLHAFGKPGDGYGPNYVLIDSAGDVFGSAAGGGPPCVKTPKGCGTIFEYNPRTEQYSTIYSFVGGTIGANPILGSIGSDGTLYGVTQNGTGVAKYGTLFALAPSATGYTLTTLAYFNNTLSNPTTGPTLTARGRLIGVTYASLYEYDLTNHYGQLLHYLESEATGSSPLGQPSVGDDGSIFGTTLEGGKPPCTIDPYGCGVLYRYTPP